MLPLRLRKPHTIFPARNVRQRTIISCFRRCSQLSGGIARIYFARRNGRGSALSTPSYAAEPLEENYPPAGTILWHLVHLAHCYKHYVNKIEQRPKQPQDILAPEAGSLEEALQNLKSYRLRLRDTFASLSDEAFNEPIASYRDVATFARMVIRHDGWHAGQIAVIRRIVRSKSA